LFSSSEGGAESWAILASIVNTAKLHDLDPQAYLGDSSRITSLLKACDILESRAHFDQAIALYDPVEHRSSTT
jgi:hypothetical protein